jgi:UDP-N-acetylmuramoyl-L-alanyl-D-glutamate--2,6-diaminopimelate ligase
MHTLNTAADAAAWLTAQGCTRLVSDSRRVQSGDGFLAWPGAATDARQFVQQALVQGACACLVEPAGAQAWAWPSDRVAALAGLKAHSGEVASMFLGQPSRALKVLAVTGTNGKTSSAWWMAQALSNLELSTPIACGLIGTLGIGMPPHVESTGLTTPDPVVLQNALAGFVAQGLGACALEASSIGLQEHRLAGTRIHTAVFTNLTQDHLDYHGSMAAYGLAKQALFEWPDLRAAVVNIDDAFGSELAHAVAARPAGVDLWTVSVSGPARLRALALEHADAGLRFVVAEGAEQVAVHTQLLGTYNVQNLLGVLGALRSLGVPLAAAAQACSRLSPVPGRLECLQAPGQPLVVVDYAHTPDALAKALEALRPLAQHRGGQLHCVFGCGGDRDATKRPLMGAVAGAHADAVMVTSDNPRSEPPDLIISQILLGLVGVAEVGVEPDRAQAIAQVVAQAAPADVVLLAGKGHEDYQEICGQRRPFSDLAQARLALGLPPTEPTKGVA